MRQARSIRGALAALAFGWLGSAGCVQHYYHAPICDPGAGQPATVCDVPSTVTRGATRSSVVGGTPPSEIVSQPQSRSAFSWRKPEPAPEIAVTNVEGAVEDTSVKR
jgi:hypothetical protein